ncbi:MAG: hypothetical protein JWL73_1107 [Actinomycetia bacterium]|nr:hypothetical protein [Actinomycetes bacterium]
MSTGVSIFLMGVGAVLAFAVTKTVNGVDLIMVGWILMGIGALGLLLSVLFWSSYSPYGAGRRRTVIEQRDEYPL